MTDEEKRAINELLETGKAIDDYYGTHGQRGCLEEAADLIEQLSAKLEQAVAENEHIRQAHVPHEAYQQVVEELDKLRAGARDAESAARYRAAFESFRGAVDVMLECIAAMEEVTGARYRAALCKGLEIVGKRVRVY